MSWFNPLDYWSTNRTSDIHKSIDANNIAETNVSRILWDRHRSG